MGADLSFGRRRRFRPYSDCVKVWSFPPDKSEFLLRLDAVVCI